MVNKKKAYLGDTDGKSFAGDVRGRDDQEVTHLIPTGLSGKTKTLLTKDDGGTFFQGEIRL